MNKLSLHHQHKNVETSFSEIKKSKFNKGKYVIVEVIFLKVSKDNINNTNNLLLAIKRNELICV